MNVPNGCSGVSVVICAYNAEKYLSRSIESILHQTFESFELIIVDDASTDTTAAIAAKYANQDHRVRLVRLAVNGGLAKARMSGFDRVRFDNIMFLDADDIAQATMIEKCMRILQSDSKIMGVATYAYYISDDESDCIGVQRIGPITKDDFFKLYHGNKLIFLPATTLFRKNHFVRAGGFRINGFPCENGIRYQDYCDDLDLWCRMSDFGSEGNYFITIPEPLFLYRKNVQSLSAQNVFAMQKKMRWIKDCLKRRRRGLPERSFVDYGNAISVLRQLTNLRADYAALFYKKAAFHYLRHEYIKAIPLIGAAGILSPKLIMQKLKTQKRRI